MQKREKYLELKFILQSQLQRWKKIHFRSQRNSFVAAFSHSVAGQTDVIAYFSNFCLKD